MTSKRKGAKKKRTDRTRGGTKIRRPQESLGDQLLREADEQHSEFAKGFRQFMKQLGIKGRPIGAKKLRERLLRNGIDPANNMASRAIVAAREE